MGPLTRRAASQDPLLPPSAGPPQDVVCVQALASLNVSLRLLDCFGVTREREVFLTQLSPDLVLPIPITLAPNVALSLSLLSPK